MSNERGERIPCDGIDLFELGSDGLVSKFTVFIRPLKAALALSSVMKAKLETAKKAAAKL